jgi:hypothetical protein
VKLPTDVFLLFIRGQGDLEKRPLRKVVMQIPAQFPNPYHHRDAVRDFNMFFGRQRELQMLYQAILKHQSVSIVGPRHIGKSSLLRFLGELELQRRYGFDLQRYIFILTDWREYLQKTREDFFHAVCDQIMTQCQHLVPIQPSLLVGEDKFRRLLEDIKGFGFHPVLLMDAFDRVTSNAAFDPHFFSFLRSLAGINDLISYVTATIKPLYKVCHSDAVAQSPFFNIFLTCSLGPLTPDEAKTLILSPTEGTPCAFLSTEVDWLFKQVGQHPFFLQVACRHLFEEKLQCAGVRNALNFEQVRKSIYQELLPHFERAWEDLEDDQKTQLKTEVFQNVQPRYQFSELSGSALFRRRVLDMFQDGLTQLSTKDIKDALDNMGDMDFLAQCKLSELQLISLQIETNVSSPATRRGMLVCDLLRNAFEHMKPGGLRNDSAPEWRLYNTCVLLCIGSRGCLRVFLTLLSS